MCFIGIMLFVEKLIKRCDDILKKIIAKIADSYGLFGLHKEYSKNDQFKFEGDQVTKLNSDYSKFYTKPFLPEVHFEEISQEQNYKNGQLRFLSQIDNEECNKEAIFHYNMCKSEDKNINVILIHGWRADNLSRLDKVFLESFIEKEYNIYNYILPFHMERSPDTSLYSGEYFVSANVSRTLKSVQQAVSDIRALITYIKETKKGKVIVIGLSLGGIISNLVAEAEENIDVLISLFYGNDLSFTVFETEAGKYMKKDFVKNNFDNSLLSKSWKIINPNLRRPVLDQNKILLVSGVFDKYVLKKDTDMLWESWGRPKRNYYNCGHSGIVLMKNKIKNDILEFIDKRI